LLQELGIPERKTPIPRNALWVKGDISRRGEKVERRREEVKRTYTIRKRPTSRSENRGDQGGMAAGVPLIRKNQSNRKDDGEAEQDHQNVRKLQR